MSTNREWLSISDMMSGLMMVFLFIAVAFMINAEADRTQAIADKQQADKDKNKVTDIANAYSDTKVKLNEALHNEFDEDLHRWGAVLDDDNNTIRFNEPSVLFEASKSDLKQAFKDILNDFFPRYIDVLTKPKFINDIIELRIEGHTSSRWKKDTSNEISYINNAWLSQSRAFSVLRYVFLLPYTQVDDNRKWLISVLRANGLSYSKLIKTKDGVEDRKKSRRVEFRIITNTEQKIKQILKFDK